MTGAEYRFVMVFSIGFVGFTLMCAAFILTAIRGGWYRASPPPEGEEPAWPFQRRLMFVGACLGVLFYVLLTLFMFIPGGISVPKGVTFGTG